MATHGAHEWVSFQVYRRCPYMTGWKIIIPHFIDEVIRALDREFSTEFLIYLKAEIDKEKRTIRVTDFYIPEQEVTETSVEVIERDKASEFEGVLHKHPTGISSFSGIDWEYANANHMFSILYEGGEYRDATVRIKAPCGHYLAVDAKVIVERDTRLKKVLEDARKKIRKKAYVYTYRLVSPYYIAEYTGKKRTRKKEKEDWEEEEDDWADYCPYYDMPESCPYRDLKTCPYTGTKCPFNEDEDDPPSWSSK